MNVTILYFAQLADLAEKTEEPINIDSGSPEQLYESLKARYRFPHEFRQIQVAINHQLSAHDTRLNEGDQVAFLPPMTGG